MSSTPHPDPRELTAWLRLALTPGLGDGAVRRLLGALGLPEQVLAAPPQAVRALLGPQAAEALLHPPPALAAQREAQVEATLRWLDAAPDQRAVLTLADAAYPAALLATDDPPPLLYLTGRLDALASGWPTALAIVGSRNPTPQGAANARAFARGLSEAGWCVVSGLALGVDGQAHEGALEGATHDGPRLATLAVVGTGLDRVYPSRHRELAQRIAQQGLILSECPLGAPPLAHHFPRRNRLIAALTQGTLVVEAALESGSLITARLASEIGREVFAIPGSIHSPQSRGCHALLRQGAKLVESVQDVIEELPLAMQSIATQSSGMPTSSPFDLKTADAGDPLLDALGHDPVGLDALAARTGLDTATLQARLLELELTGAVGRLPGGLFQRVAQA